MFVQGTALLDEEDGECFPLVFSRDVSKITPRQHLEMQMFREAFLFSAWTLILLEARGFAVKLRAPPAW